MDKILIILRHAESEKNIKHRLSSDAKSEKLTVRGITQANYMGQHIDAFLKNNNLRVKNIYCSSSIRAIETAEIIAKQLNANIESCEEFKSFSVGDYAGKSERCIKKIYPDFINNLSLYRKSLVNSYDIIYKGTKETLQEYESKVKERLQSILLNNENENCKVVIMHRSAFTATLIDIARLNYGYPKDFYGYVQINFGTVSVVKIYENKAEFILACSHSRSLLDTFIN